MHEMGLIFVYLFTGALVTGGSEVSGIKPRWFTVLMAVSAAMLWLFAAGSVSTAHAIENSTCLSCHADTQPMIVAPVNRVTACKACHLPFVGAHPYHQAGANCGAACHPGWGSTASSAMPLYLDPVSGAAFASADSADTPASVLHVIHSNASWPATVPSGGSDLVAGCSSCHSVAACNACHTGAIASNHALHSATGNAAYDAATPWTGTMGRGVLGGDQTMRTATVVSNQCASIGCHNIAATQAQKPVLFEDVSASTTGSWRPRFGTMYTGGRMSYSNVAGNQISVTISGARVEIISDRDPYRGKADVLVDGIVVGTFDAYSSTSAVQAVAYTVNLGAGVHTVTVRVRGDQNASARGCFIVLDAFRVYPAGIAIAKPNCDSCHADKAVPHPDPAAHDVILALNCSGCHGASLITEHDPDAEGPATGCATCHTSLRDDVKAAVRGGVTDCAACHALDHAALHGNTWTTCAGVGCHNATHLVAVHPSIPCEGCHNSPNTRVTAAIAAGDKNCPTCHNPMQQHGAVHEASPTYAALVEFPGPVGMGGPSYTLKCLSCHRTNLLTNHGSDYSNCSMCHLEGGPRASFTIWDTNCQTGACHPGGRAPHLPPHTVHYHNRMSVGEQPEGMCQSCHANPEGWQCGSPFGCHTGAVPPATIVDFQRPVTVASRVSETPITWKLLATDVGDGVAETYYSFDGGPWLLYSAADAVNGIVNPADSHAPYLHSLRYYSVDRAGNAEAIQTTDYDVNDNTPPVITFNVLSGTTTTKSLTMSVTDPKVNGLNSGVASVQMETVVFYKFWNNWVGNGGVMPWYKTLGCSAAYPLDASWDSTRVITNIESSAAVWHYPPNQIERYIYPSGASCIFYVKYSATDYAGNQSAVVETAFTIDNDPPVTTTSSAGTYRWKLNATDTASAGVDKTYYSFDGASFAVYTAADHTAGIANTQPGGSNPGAHTLRYYSVDKLGNTEAIKTLDYTVP